VAFQFSRLLSYEYGGTNQDIYELPNPSSSPSALYRQPDANRYNGEDDRAYEESDKARELVEMAQPLLDELKELIQKA